MDRLICAVCLEPVPYGVKQVESKASPYPTCGPEHKAFASSRTYTSPEELHEQYLTTIRHSQAVDRFLYGHLRFSDE